MKPSNESVDPKRTIPICFGPGNLKILEEYAKKNGMLDWSQAVEYLARNMHID